MIDQLARVSKALATLLGGVATLIVSTFPESQSAQLVAGLLGLLGTVALVYFAPPNTPVTDGPGDAGAGELRLILCVVAGCLLAYFLVAVL